MQKAVLITSLPRSGSHYLRKNLIDCGIDAHQVGTSQIPNIIANNIMAKNIFKEKFKFNGDLKTSKEYEKYIISVCVIRKPEDSIISHITQQFYNNFYKATFINSFELNIDKIVNNATFIAKAWQNDFLIIKNNIESVLPFTFEQLIKTPEKVINAIAKETNYLDDYTFNNLQTENIEKVDENKNYTRNIYYLKTSKSVFMYNEFNGVLKNHPLFKDLNKDYISLLDTVKERQKSLNTLGFN